MNSGIKTFYALKSVKVRRFFRKPIIQTIIVASTNASNWLWAERNLACEGVKYDVLVQKV